MDVEAGGCVSQNPQAASKALSRANRKSKKTNKQLNQYTDNSDSAMLTKHVFGRLRAGNWSMLGNAVHGSHA